MKKKKIESKLSFERASILELNHLVKIKGGVGGGKDDNTYSLTDAANGDFPSQKCLE